MAKKITYTVYSEGSKPQKNPILYNYSRTKNIELSVSKTGFCIKYELSVLKETNEILFSPLVKDGLKKAALIQLIKFGEISDKKIYVMINEEEHLIYDPAVNGRLLYPLCGNILRSKVLENWNHSCLTTIANTSKTSTTRLDASLYSFLLAKSKEFESEKFIYNWMAMNGLYGWISSYAKQFTTNKKVLKWLKSEKGEIEFFARSSGLQFKSDLEKNHENQYIIQIETILDKIKVDEIDAFVLSLKENNIENNYVKDVTEIVEKYCPNTSPYAALLLLTSYKIRCKYFHSENALPLLSFENEHPIPAIRVLNKIIQDYLSNQLYKYFDKSVLENELCPRIETVVKGLNW